MNYKNLKILGIVSTVVGIGASLVSSWVGEQERDRIIDEKVNEAIENRK